MMPGGQKESYERVRPVFEAVAAKVGNDPCVAYLGPGSAGHYVKMVHNGIEYGLMQLISETYDLMKRGLGMNDDALGEIYSDWNGGELNSYLIEITSDIFRKRDEKTGKRLIDEILDVARQKGTGMWTSQSGMELQVSIPTIDIAVGVRNLSMVEQERKQASRLYKRAVERYRGDAQAFVKQLKEALYVAMTVTYAQGMALLSSASGQLHYNLDLEAIARIWRGGCIIRAALLEDIRRAYKKAPDLPNLLLDGEFANRVMERQENLRRVIAAAVEIGVPVPALMASLGYLDGYRSAWLPANLIEAQRDFFGAHAYERIDAKGTFHTEWTHE